MSTGLSRAFVRSSTVQAACPERSRGGSLLSWLWSYRLACPEPAQRVEWDLYADSLLSGNESDGLLPRASASVVVIDVTLGVLGGSIVVVVVAEAPGVSRGCCRGCCLCAFSPYVVTIAVVVVVSTAQAPALPPGS